MGRISGLLFGFLFVSVAIGAASYPLAIHVFHFPTPSGYDGSFNWFMVVMMVIGAVVGLFVWLFIVFIVFALIGVGEGILSIFRKPQTKNVRNYSTTEKSAVTSNMDSKDAINSGGIERHGRSERSDRTRSTISERTKRSIEGMGG